MSFLEGTVGSPVRCSCQPASQRFEPRLSYGSQAFVKWPTYHRGTAASGIAGAAPSRNRQRQTSPAARVRVESCWNSQSSQFAYNGCVTYILKGMKNSARADGTAMRNEMASTVSLPTSTPKRPFKASLKQRRCRSQTLARIADATCSKSHAAVVARAGPRPGSSGRMARRVRRFWSSGPRCEHHPCGGS